LPDVFVELRINKSLGTGHSLSRKVTIINCILLAIHQDVITSLVLGRSVP
jgi:energy-converting hydrogenase Eha subunit A